MKKSWSNAKKTQYDNQTFDSKAELTYYKILKTLQKENKIIGFKRQVRFPLPDMDGGLRFSYTCDFVLTQNDSSKVYIEVKGRWMPGNKIRYAYWQIYYDKALTIVPTTGLKKFHIDWLQI